VLKSFSLTVSPDGSVTAGIEVDAVEGMADTGNLSDDLTDLLVALGEAAQDRETGVVFLLDEVQFLLGRAEGSQGEAGPQLPLPEIASRGPHPANECLAQRR
jgi:hypothetical protein